jgi:CRP-like cAMP-binding protein
LDLLAKSFTALYLEPGETLMRRGAIPEALFIIASGTMEATKSEPGGTRVLGRLSPGETIGAVSLITGSTYAATATTLTPLKAYRLGEPDIAAAIKALPELSIGLEALAQRGQAIMHREAVAHDSVQLDYPDLLLSRLRSFLRVLRT